MSEYYQDPQNVLSNGLTLLQINPDCAADLRQESQYFGWLFTRGPEVNQWVTMRKLSAREIEDAYDQAATMMVLRIVRVG